MTWPTLRAIVTATRCKFSAAMARRHLFVRLANGSWCRTLGPVPENARHIRGRLWEMRA